MSDPDVSVLQALPSASPHLGVGLHAVCQNLQGPFLEQLLFLLLKLVDARVGGHRTGLGAPAVYRLLGPWGLVQASG